MSVRADRAWLPASDAGGDGDEHAYSVAARRIFGKSLPEPEALSDRLPRLGGLGGWKRGVYQLCQGWPVLRRRDWLGSGRRWLLRLRGRLHRGRAPAGGAEVLNERLRHERSDGHTLVHGRFPKSVRDLGWDVGRKDDLRRSALARGEDECSREGHQKMLAQEVGTGQEGDV
jgi:hypothetical protein